MSHIVCDTNVLVSGLLWPGTATGAVLARVAVGDDRLFTTEELLLEFVHVLARATFQRRLREVGLFPLDLLRSVAATAVLVEPLTLDRVRVPDDPDADMVPACAATVRPDCIVTGDRHLLQLARFESAPILTAAAYLAQFHERSSHGEP